MPLAYGLIQPTDLALPHLPVSLDGLRIAHLSDLHIKKHTKRHSRLINQLTSLRLDLVLFTGDYITFEEHADDAFGVMQRICAKLRPGVGMFGVFGNHDTIGLQQHFAELPVHWLNNQAIRLPDRPLEILGYEEAHGRSPDPVATALDWVNECGEPDRDPHTRPLRLLLTHRPTMLPSAADMGADLCFSGHTHGGQIRPPTGHALVNSSDFPLGLTTGLLRHRHTQMAISRGLGEMTLPLRMFCAPHVPVYTLRRRTTPGRFSNGIYRVWHW